MSLRQQVVSSLKWTAAARLTGQVLSWLITILVIRLLSPDDYGVMAAAMVVIGLAFVLDEMGMVSGMVQAKEIDDSLVANVFGFVLLSNLLFVAILQLTAPLVAAYFEQSEVEPVVRVLSLTILIGAFGSVPEALLRRALRFKEISVLTLVGTVTANLVTLALAYAGYGVWALVVGALVRSCLLSIGYWIVLRFSCWPHFRFSRLGGIIRFGLNVSAQRVVAYLSSQADQLIIGRLLGAQMLGYYSVGTHLATLPMSRLMGLINSVAFPAYSKVQDDVARARDYFLLSSSLLVLVSLPVFWGLASVAEPFVEVVLGEQWLPSAFVISLAGLVAPARLVTMLLSPMLDGLGRPDIGLRNVVTLALVFPPLVYLGYLAGEFEGLVVFAALAYLLVAFINCARSLRVLEIGLGQILRLLAPTLASGLLMVFGVLGLDWLLLEGQPDLLRLLAMVTTGAAIYLALTWLLNRDAVSRLISLVRQS